MKLLFGLIALFSITSSHAAGPLPVTLTLDKPGFVTAVIERADGRRVGNLVSEVKAQAGALTLNWGSLRCRRAEGREGALRAHAGGAGHLPRARSGA